MEVIFLFAASCAFLMLSLFMMVIMLDIVKHW